MTIQWHLTDEDQHVILTALRIAAEVYRQDAEKVASHSAPVSRQFLSQAEQAERLLTRLED